MYREKEGKARTKALAQVVKNVMKPRYIKILRMLYTENWPDLAECLQVC